MKQSKIYRLLTRVPVLGSVMKIANAYAFRGDERYVAMFAPWKAWYDRVLTKILVALFVSFAAAMCANALGVQPKEVGVADVIVGVFPSLLGFGIGVFALIFVLPSSFVLTILKMKKETGPGPYVLASDMGYPLIVLAVVLFFGAFMRFFPSGQPTFFASTFLLFYGLVMMIELVSMVFITAVMVLRDKSKDASCEKGKSAVEVDKTPESGIGS